MESIANAIVTHLLSHPFTSIIMMACVIGIILSVFS